MRQRRPLWHYPAAMFLNVFLILAIIGVIGLVFGEC